MRCASIETAAFTHCVGGFEMCRAQQTSVTSMTNMLAITAAVIAIDKAWG
jgi:hypothetical protein